MHCLLLVAALANTRPALAASLDEGPAAISSRIMGELDQPQAISDLFRLYERRDDLGDLSQMDTTLMQASAARRARPDVRALASEIRAELALARGQLPRHRRCSTPSRRSA